jgi:hypothetical protein
VIQTAAALCLLMRAKKRVRWEDLFPTPIKSDWIETKSGEWFRGKIKGLYNDALEFDSDELGVHTFDFDDIKMIKSYQILREIFGRVRSLLISISEAVTQIRRIMRHR